MTVNVWFKNRGVSTAYNKVTDTAEEGSFYVVYRENESIKFPISSIEWIHEQNTDEEEVTFDR